MSLRTCAACDGLIPATHAACPHCDRPVRRGARWVARAVAAGGALVTLMACYGMMARPYDYNATPDGDGDGVHADQDCDDARPDVYPGAADQDGDGVDQNCDGVDGWADPNAPRPAMATDPDAGALAPTPPVPSAPLQQAVDPP